MSLGRKWVLIFIWNFVIFSSKCCCFTNISVPRCWGNDSVKNTEHSSHWFLLSADKINWHKQKWIIASTLNTRYWTSQLRREVGWPGEDRFLCCDCSGKCYWNLEMKWQNKTKRSVDANFLEWNNADQHCQLSFLKILILWIYKT